MRSRIFPHLGAQNTTQKTAPDYPKFEAAVDFSFINVHPDLPIITSFNVFGGGLDGVYNFTPLIGVKAAFQFYTQGSGVKNKLTQEGYWMGFISLSS